MPSPPSKQTPAKPAPAKPKRKLSRFRLILLILLVLIVVTCGIGGGKVFSIVSKTPPFDPKVLAQTNQTSLVFDKDGTQIGVLHADENREIADSKEITDQIKNAFITVEDIRFNDHIGVDPIGILRAAISTYITKTQREGGSTITIQLARDAFSLKENSLTRKIQEASLALKLERLYTKDEILTMYLNRIFFGEGAYGIKAAAKTYFGKDISKEDTLDIGEIALLVGLPKGPSIYDPFMYPEQAKFRRNIVLGVLRDNKVISQAEYDKYKDAPFEYVEKLKQENKNPEAANKTMANVTYSFPYFVDFALNELQEYGISQDAIYSGGLKIYTTVDPKIQAAAESAYADPKNFPKNIDGQPVESAMVIMDPNDGSVRAMVGGRNYRTAKDFNRAWQAMRQPGSSIKPLVAYTPALEKGGYFPGTVLDDMPVKYRGGDGKEWAPTDFDTAGGGGWRGLITMREALRDSVNVFAVKLLDKIGINYAWQFAKEKFGLPLTDRDKVLSLALGTPEVTVLDMVSAYSAFPTGGVQAKRHTILKVVDRNGTVLVNNSNPEKKRIMKEQTAFIMQDMLHGVVTGGTGTAAQFGNWFIGGKTGTTSMADYKRTTGTRDIWFMGFTPNYVGGVWMGFDQTTDTRNMRGYYGGGPTAQLWRKVMITAHEGLPVVNRINKPGGLSSITFDTKSGLSPSSLTPPQFIRQDYAIQSSMPGGSSEVWTEIEVCADTGRLPGPNTLTKVSKVFLNVNREGVDAAWPNDEEPFKPPTETCDMAAPAPIEDPLEGLTAELNPAKTHVLLSLNVNGTYQLQIDINSGQSIVKTDQVSGKIVKLSIALPQPKPPKNEPDTYDIVVYALDPITNKPLTPPLTASVTVD